MQAVVDNEAVHKARVEVRGEGARALGRLAAAVEARSAGIHKVTAIVEEIFAVDHILFCARVWRELSRERTAQQRIGTRRRRARDNDRGLKP